MKVAAIHDNADGFGKPSGCGWYRIVMPLDELRRHGHDVTYSWDQPETPSDWPLIVAQRMDKPEALKTWRRFRAHSRLIYEIDDDIWGVTKANWMAYRVYSQLANQDVVEHSIAIANAVTVTTEPLAEVVKKFNERVYVIPNFIPGELLSWKRDEPREVFVRSKPVRKVVIGWRGGASHALDVGVIAKPVRHVLQRNPQARLHIIGTDFRPTIGVDADFTNWVPVDASLDFYRTLTGIDIGLAPLFGVGFDDSKSNIAALEYAALGIPCIATYSPAYSDFIEDGRTGYLIKRKSDWAKRIAELVNDHDAREEMGAAARERAAAWTIEENWARWLAVYKELVNG